MFKSLGIGEAIMILPHDAGTKAFKIKFDRFEDLPPIPLLVPEKEKLISLEEIASNQSKSIFEDEPKEAS